jgi:hypothetical protein
MSFRLRPVALICFVALASGCATADGGKVSEVDGSVGAGRCAPQIRLAGVVYTGYGYTERAATRHAVADEADCQDVGKDARGSVFPDDPRQVTTWTFKGFPPEKVVGVRFERGSYSVFVAETVPDREGARIFRSLSR